MAEKTWVVAADPLGMLEFLRTSGQPSERKLRLFAAACWRCPWVQLDDRRDRESVEASEQFADGLLDKDSLHTAWQRAEGTARVAALFKAYNAAFASAMHVGTIRQAPSTKGDTGGNVLCALLHDIFGNLFEAKSPIDPSWLAWNAGTVRRLAEQIYEERSFDRMPVLADAMEEAGCADQDILGHLRGPGPHALGCWPLDLLTGRE